MIADFADIEYKQAIEEKIKYEADRKNIECLMSYEMSFMNNDEINEILFKEGVDAVLVILPTASGTNSYYVPPTTETKTKGTIQRDYWGHYSFKSKSTTTTSGGYSGTKPWTRVFAELYDIETGDKVWNASASTGGNAWANFKTCLRSAGGKIIVKLDQDGFIAKEEKY